ncbi:hypothetical protein TRFO_20495 [Tritrichomonas foetus]|uniref:SGF29 C-terminal domain-containing protein n=1 Tax=Tritrichomonas foetus TaxID=1144522 RepID=A0A1J4KG75_9EUKA|nr:hypothetical protein TRFO_20495 [Tritrichomonas foetus]|eukprot:OHT10211.1 hypothetical protein TRFO_20495 [Tritrichomonas foetus]
MDYDNLKLHSNNTKNAIEYLNRNLKKLSESNCQLNQNSHGSQKKDTERIHHLIIGQFNKSFDEITQVIKITENLLNEANRNNSNSNENRLPSVKDVKENLKSFFIDKIKTKSSPIPTYCGCYAYKNRNIKEGSFICARIITDGKSHFYLYMTTKHENGFCEAFDPTADDLEKEIKVVQFKDDDWTPLPTIIPERPIKRWEHTKSSTVLSLFPEAGEWTTEFYLAKVLAQPSERSDSDERGYELEFEDNSVHIVSEKFVVYYPPHWKT